MFSLSHPHGRRGIVSGFGLTRTNVWDKPRQIGQGEEADAPHAAGQYASSDEESGWSDGEAPAARRSGGGGGGKRRPTVGPARHSVAGSSGGGGRQAGGHTLHPRPATARASVGTARRGRSSVERLVEGGGGGSRPGYVVVHACQQGARYVNFLCCTCFMLCVVSARQHQAIPLRPHLAILPSGPCFI